MSSIFQYLHINKLLRDGILFRWLELHSALISSYNTYQYNTQIILVHHSFVPFYLDILLKARNFLALF